MYADLVRYRELFANLFRRDFQAKYRGSVLGVAWSLVNPLVLMGVYLVVFGVILNLSREVPHYPLYLLTGIACWTFFALSLQTRVALDGRQLGADPQGALPAPARRLLGRRDAGGDLRGDARDPHRPLARLRPEGARDRLALAAARGRSSSR